MIKKNCVCCNICEVTYKHIYKKMLKYDNKTKTTLCSVMKQEWDNNEICREVS